MRRKLWGSFIIIVFSYFCLKTNQTNNFPVRTMQTSSQGQNLPDLSILMRTSFGPHKGRKNTHPRARARTHTGTRTPWLTAALDLSLVVVALFSSLNAHKKKKKNNFCTYSQCHICKYWVYLKHKFVCISVEICFLQSRNGQLTHWHRHTTMSTNLPNFSLTFPFTSPH